MSKSEIKMLRKIADSGMLGSHEMDLSPKTVFSLKQKGIIITNPADINRVIVTDLGATILSGLPKE